MGYTSDYYENEESYYDDGPTWETKNGSVIYLDNADDNHLNNIKILLERRIQSGSEYAIKVLKQVDREILKRKIYRREV